MDDLEDDVDDLEDDRVGADYAREWQRLQKALAPPGASWWANSGGSADLVTPAGTSTRKAQLARLSLPIPHAVAVQISVVDAALRGDSILRGILTWQSERGIHTAQVDIAGGTSIVLGAAQSVEVTALLTSTGPTSCTVRASMAPAAGFASRPPTFSDVRTSIAGGGGTATFSLPAFSKRVTLAVDNSAAFGATTLLRVVSSGSVLSERQVTAGDQWLSIPAAADGVQVVNGSAVNPALFVVIHELAL